MTSHSIAVEITAKYLAEKSNKADPKVNIWRSDAEELVNFKQRARVLAMTKNYFPLLTVKELKQRYKMMGLSMKGLSEKDEMVRKLQEATEDDGEYVMTWEKKKTIGIKLERTNDWGIVLNATPNKEGLPVIGSVLTRINDESVILKPHTELESLLKSASWPLELQFRRPPSKKGVLIKQSRAVKGYRNWKKRFFNLQSGVLSYYDKEEGGRLKGTFLLRNEKGSQCMVTLAPRKLLADNEVGVMIVKGEDLLVLKGETPEEMMEWAAVIYYAVSLHNGGNPDIFELESRRLTHLESEMEKKRQMEEAVTLQALASEEEQSRRLKEEAELHKQMIEEQQRELEREAEAARLEADRVSKEEKEKLEELTRQAAEEEKRLQAELEREKKEAEQAKADAEQALQATAEMAEQERVLSLAVEKEQAAAKQLEETTKEMEALKISLETLAKEKEDAELVAKEALRAKSEQEALLQTQLDQAQMNIEAANKKLMEDESALNKEQLHTEEAAASTAKVAAQRRASVAMAPAMLHAMSETEENDLAEKAAEQLIAASEGQAEGSSTAEGNDDDESDDEVSQEPEALPGATFQLSAPSGLVVGGEKLFEPKYVKDDKAWML